MEDWKAFIAERRRVEVLQSRRQYASLALRDFKRTYAPLVDDPESLVPGAADFWNFPVVSVLINAPGDESSILPFKNTAEQIPTFIESWRRVCIQDIIHLLLYLSLPYPVDHPAKIQQIQLAVAVFTCSKNLCHNDAAKDSEAHQYMYYPEYLHHRCNRIRARNYSDEDEEELAKALGVGYHRYPDAVIRQKWSCKHLHYDEKASGVIKNILQACGWDWKTTTAADMDRRDPRLVCLKCSFNRRCDGERIMMVRGWRSAVSSVSTHLTICANKVIAGGPLHVGSLGWLHGRMGEGV